MRSTADAILEQWSGWKRQHDGTYRGNCPYRSDSDSKGFVLTIDDGEHGAYTDHPRHESGSLYDLAEKMGIETPKDGRVQVDSTKRTYDSLADYAKRHYAPVEAFVSAGWEYTQHNGRPIITYPVSGGKRGRYIDDKSHKSPYVWIGENAGNVWYGLSRAVQMALQSGNPLVLCNGEASTIVAQHHGIPAFCGVGGEGAINELMQDELASRWDGALYVAFDCDESGDKATERVLGMFPQAVAIDLGLSDKGDLADFCGLHAKDSMKALKRISDSQQQTARDEIAQHIEFVNSEQLLSDFSKFINDDANLFTRVIRMPFKGLRRAGGFADTMTTKKIWLIGNVSGGGKTIMSETLCDMWNADGYNVLYVGDEWSPMELTARQIQRANPSPQPVTYMDYLAYRDGRRTFEPRETTDISLAMRTVRSREGKTWFMKVSDSFTGVTFLEDIMQAISDLISRLRQNGTRMDVIILDYLSLYDTRAQTGNNPEEYKVGVFKSYCKTLDVLGVSTVQVKKEAEDRVMRTGGYLNQHDLFWVRPDKGNLITTMNRVYKSNFEVSPDGYADSDSRHKPFLDDNGQPELTPNMCMVVVKNSVASAYESAYFHFDYDHMRLCEGIHHDYYFDKQFRMLLPKDHPHASAITHAIHTGTFDPSLL